ncbi:MAG: type IV pilin protein [Rhodothermaceae bacterium]
MTNKFYKNEEGFSLTELLVALVIIGILVLLALPRLMPIVNKAKATEAKLNLKQVYMLQKAYKFERDTYSDNLARIGFEQEKLVTDGGTARYKITIRESSVKNFIAEAKAVVDFDDDGTFNTWVVGEDGIITEETPD